MYYPNDIEEICYDQNHINEVVTELKKNIPSYLEKYIETEGGKSVSDDKLQQLQSTFGSTSGIKKKKLNKKDVIHRLLTEAVDEFESEREPYLEHLDMSALEEYAEDVSSFKNTILKNQIPIIRKTLQNVSAKDLDRYRAAFKLAEPSYLFNVVNTIVQKAEELKREWYDKDSFEHIATCEALDYFPFDDEEYTAFGVIGGGIKSHFIYKLYPEMFPNRGREAVWALWYLSGKKPLGCREDSQFLMINIEESTTQQNYFYPYALFSFYALEIYRILRDFYQTHNVTVAKSQRFIVVDAFLSFVARQHQSEIDDLIRQLKGKRHDY